MVPTVCGRIGILLVCMATLPGCHDDQVPPRYLLMTTTMDDTLTSIPDSKVAQLEGLPFDGVAISVLRIYDGGPLPEEARLLTDCRRLRSQTKMTIWPKVHLNRLVGYGPTDSNDQRTDNQQGRIDSATVPEWGDPATKTKEDSQQYFWRIRGLDVWNRAGARTDFLRLWTLALRAAKTLGSPGIVLDPETYNFMSTAYPIPYAREAGMPLYKLQDALRLLGQEMADIANREYPHAMIWSLYTQLGKTTAHWWNELYGGVTNWRNDEKRFYRPFPPPRGRRPLPHFLLSVQAYIFEGFLQRAKVRRMPLTVVDCGEGDVPFINASPYTLEQKIGERNVWASSAVGRFGDRLRLGGPITVWDDEAQLTSWVAGQYAEINKMQDLHHFEDFQPNLTVLFRNYRYVWICVPSCTDYRPLDDDPDQVAKSQKLRDVLLLSGWRPLDPSR